MEEINGTITPEQYIDGHMDIAAYSSGGGGGTSNYNQLLNKPQINGVELTGNKITAQLNISYNDIYDKPFIPSSYNEVSEHPTINGVELTGNKTTSQLNINYNDLNGKPTIPTISEIVNTIYPVGSVYISISDLNPGTIMGGVWESFGAGKALVGVDADDTDFDIPEKTGGEKAHTLTVDEMPSHNHNILRPRWSTAAGANAVYGSNGTGSGSNRDADAFQGGGQAHNNLQPYITVYFWKRTA